jgi:alpha-1,3-rhamnosyl/mannosyltransferase
MSRGLPVVASNTSSLPEVGGDAALYVDPYSLEEIAAKVRQVVEDGNLRAELIRRGSERAQRFTWQGTAERTLEVYDAVLSQHKNAAAR